MGSATLKSRTYVYLHHCLSLFCCFVSISVCVPILRLQFAAAAEWVHFIQPKVLLDVV